VAVEFITKVDSMAEKDMRRGEKLRGRTFGVNFGAEASLSGRVSHSILPRVKRCICRGSNLRTEERDIQMIQKVT
jgi:hypothetical protein